MTNTTSELLTFAQAAARLNLDVARCAPHGPHEECPNGGRIPAAGYYVTAEVV